MNKGQLLAMLDETINNYSESIKIADAKFKLLAKDPRLAYFDGKTSWSYSTVTGKKESFGTASIEHAKEHIVTDIEIFTNRRKLAEDVKRLASHDSSSYPNVLERAARRLYAELKLLQELSTYDVGKEHDWSLQYRNCAIMSVKDYLAGVPAEAEMKLIA
ncbi:MAG: hypothetical protein NT016_00845 [Candidatus Aenigmarchaeota archaeon]|nr:hypothetical protein [Candidatus Aenigmarchaeota archaeon]